MLTSDHRNPSSPRLASSSKDGSVRVWSTLTRRTEYTLGGHSASVNVVKWGGAGGPRGVLYTASSDRTVRIWDAEKVRFISTYNNQTSLDEIPAGPTTTYVKRTCALGDNSNSKHRFCSTNRAIRSYWKKTNIGWRRLASHEIIFIMILLISFF